MQIKIRNVDIQTDIQSIREAHGSDEHWGSDEACFMSQKTRLENGFYIQVATCEDEVIGHAEWILSCEPGYNFLYLGMMAINEKFQKRGIGTKLLDSGAAYAKKSGCNFLRTMPNIESGSFQFYEKNGFSQTKDSNSTLKLETISAPINTAVRTDKVPFDAIRTLPFVMGLYQHSSRHMWNIYNAQSENDERTVSSFRIGESYINIGAFEPTEYATATCWSKQATPALITEILAVGGSLGYKYLNFCVLDETVPLFESFVYEISDEHDIFMERQL